MPAVTKAEHRGRAMARGLAAGGALVRLGVGAAGEEVARSHREAISEEVREAEDQDDPLGEVGAHDARTRRRTS